MGDLKNNNKCSARSPIKSKSNRSGDHGIYLSLRTIILQKKESIFQNSATFSSNELYM